MRLLLLILITGIIQTMFNRYLSIGEYHFNILFVFSIEISLIGGRVPGMVFGFFSGIIEDLLFFGMLGTKSMLRVLMAFYSGSLKGKYAVNNIVFQLILVFLLSIIYFFSIYLIRTVFYQPISISPGIIFNAALNAISGPFIYAALKKIYV